MEPSKYQEMLNEFIKDQKAGWLDPPGWQQPSPVKPFVPSAIGSFGDLMSTDNERRYTESNMHGMLQSRMGWNMYAPQCPHRKVVPFKLDDEKVAIFVVHKDKALIFEDEVGLFPSDGLVTQLRLLAEDK